MRKRKPAGRRGKGSSQVMARVRAQKSPPTSLRAALRLVNDLTDDTIPPIAIEYFRARIKNEAHDHILRTFDRLQSERGINKVFLARRLGKDPAQIHRLLGAPGNWTLETVADLLMAMGQASIIDSEDAVLRLRHNVCTPEYEKAVYAHTMRGLTCTKAVQVVHTVGTAPTVTTAKNSLIEVSKPLAAVTG